MEHVLQPPQSRICTQCSVAMVTGAELDEVIQHFGHAKESNLTEAWRAMQALGITENRWLPKVDNRYKVDLSGKGILRIHVEGRDLGHMVAFEDGIIYDPEGYVYNGAHELRKDYYARQGRRWKLDYVLYVY